MKLVLSLSNDLINSSRSDLSGTIVECGQRGVPVLQTHSTQICWQLHSVAIDCGWVVVAVEAYSRYTFFIPYFDRPSWDQVLADFQTIYLHELYWCLGTGGFVEAHQLAVINRHFKVIDDPLCVCGVDAELANHMVNAKRWLSNYFEKTPSPLVEGVLMKELTRQVNRLAHKSNEDQVAELIFPIDRFLRDSLFRFAHGLCDLDLLGCKSGSFPNPHRKSINLYAVPSQRSQSAH